MERQSKRCGNGGPSYGRKSVDLKMKRLFF
jgi:hypothetical protein